MSDTSQGDGWWQASDAKWYPPEAHPSAKPAPPPPTVGAGATPPYSADGNKKKPGCMTRTAIVAAVALVVIIAVTSLASSGGGDDEAAQSDSAAQDDSGDSAENATLAGTRENPIPVNTPVEITIDALGDADGSKWSLTVLPGADITPTVLGENQFNDPPAEGELFYGVPIELTLVEAGKEPLSTLFNMEFEFFGPASNKIIGSSMDDFLGCGVVPGEFDSSEEAFIGGTIGGTICFPVTQADVDAGPLFTMDSVEGPGFDGERVFIATR